MSATHTPNLNLAKPDREDYVSVVADLNDNMDIIDAAFASIQNTLRKVPISIAVGDWTLDDGVYYAEFSTAYITDASFEFVFFDRSYKQYAVADVNANKRSGGGGLDFDTTTIPTGTITGTAYVFATNDGKLPVIIENTVIDIANGGTGQSSVSGVQSAFGIGDLTQLHTVDKTNLVSAVNENADNIVTLNSKIATKTTAITSIASQSNYTLTTGGVTNLIARCGNVVTIQMCVTCSTPYTNSPGVEVLSNVPIPASGEYLFSSFPVSSIDSAAGRSLRVIVRNNGKLYFRHGEASKNYDIVLTYITA